MASTTGVIEKTHILEVLKQVKCFLPGKGETNVVDGGLVGAIVIKGEKIGFALEVPSTGEDRGYYEQLRNQCEVWLRKDIKEIKDITIVLTSEQGPSVAASQDTVGMGGPQAVSGVEKIILVASGKGGVGKSTVTAYLAKALVQLGKRVGIVDADIYGPSMPLMLGVEGKPAVNEKKQLVPLEKEGIQSMSIGYLVDAGQAAVWRGPMVVKALHQLFRGVAWQGREYLLVDMPPGTGDIQLSLAKHYPVYGAILVTTPQEVAVADVRKAADMFRKVGVKLLGVVENMSYFALPGTEGKQYIFGKGGGKKLAQALTIPLLAEIPLQPDVVAEADGGKMLQKEVFITLAREIISQEHV